MNQEFIKELMDRKGLISEEESERIKKDIAEKLPELPDVKGWECLLLLYIPLEKKTKGGIILTDNMVDQAKFNSTCGLVLKLGELAFKDDTRFPNGAWAKVGDWVLFPRGEASTRITCDDVAMILAPDDRMRAVIGDPTQYVASSLKINI